MVIQFIRGADFDYTSWGGCYYNVNAEGTEATPITFKDVIDFFESSPISSPLLYPSYGDLCENNSAEWTTTGATVSDDNIIFNVGSYSIKFLMTSSPTSINFTWRPPTGNKHMQATSTEKIKLWVRSDVTATVESLSMFCYYNSSVPELYEIKFPISLNLIANTWTEIIIDPHNYSDIESRFFWDRVSRIDIKCSGLSSGDSFYIDGLHCYVENPNPREIYGGVYYFPCCCYFYSTWFKDLQFIFISGMKHGNTIISAYGQNIFGAISGRVGGCQIYQDSIVGSDGANSIVCYHNSGNFTEIYNTRFDSYSKGSTGINVITNYGTGYLKIQNIILDNCLDGVYGGGTKYLDNVSIGFSRYPLWVSGTNYLSNITLTRDSTTSYGYLWLSDNAITYVKGVKLINFTSTNRFLFSRTYNIGDTEAYLIDVEFQDCDKSTILGELRTYNVTSSSNYVTQGVGFSLDVYVIDEESNNLEGVNILVQDKNKNIILDVNTNSGGRSENNNLVLTTYTLYGNGTSNLVRYWKPFAFLEGNETGGQDRFPFDIIITKTGYMPYIINDFTPTEKINLFIVLKKLSSIIYDVEGENYKRLDITNPDSKIIHL